MSVTILLVEDDPVLLTVLRELLEFGGHSVVTCGNGREAVQQVSVAQIDLVITDLSMPEMDGVELIKVLAFEWPDIRVIAMSGFLDSRARRLTEMYAVDALLEKPFSLEEMLNVVQVSVGAEACKRADRVQGVWFRN
jgi:two-component system response regulator YesN